MSTKSLPNEIAALERKLKALLKERPPYHRDVEILVTELRDAVEDVILKDLFAAHAADLDSVLWIRVHHPVIEGYKKLLHKIQPQIKTKPTEARKLQDFFVKFVKSASQFYRTYIQQLVAQFGVRELEPIIARFHMEVIRSPRAPKKPSDQLRVMVLRSCHRSLVCLGDLSRYREMHSFDSVEKEWRPALNYYILAKQLCPSLGFPHNQIAVISIFEGSVLSSQYHFYRAMCVQEPFPTAAGNLSLGYKKFLNNPKIAKVDGPYKRDEVAVSQTLESFLTWHANAYQTGRAPEDDTLEAGTLETLRTDIVDRKLTTDILTKVVLINICSYHIAKQDAMRKELAMQLLNFNVAMLACLLKVLNEELETVRSSEAPIDIQTEGVSAVARRVLYGLRIYSAWLMVNARSMTLAEIEQYPTLSVQLRSLWMAYADALSSIAILFGNLNLEKTDVLLKEDIDLIGCEPLKGGFQGIRGRAEELTFVEIEEITSRLHPTQETLLRISDLLTDAVTLSNRDEIPLIFEEEKFTYCPPRIMSTPSGTEAVPSPEFSSQSFYSMNQSRLAKSHLHYTDPAISAVGGKSSVAGSVGSEPSVSYMMNAMVDYLVQDDELDSGRASTTAERADNKNLDEVLFSRSRRSKKESNDHGRGRQVQIPELSSRSSSAFSPWNPIAPNLQAPGKHVQPGTNPATFGPFSGETAPMPAVNSFQFSNQGFDPFGSTIGIQPTSSAHTFGKSPSAAGVTYGGDGQKSFPLFKSSANELDPSFQALNLTAPLSESSAQQISSSRSSSSFDASPVVPSGLLQTGPIPFYPPQVRMHKSISAMSKRTSIPTIATVSPASETRQEQSSSPQIAGRWYSEPAQR
ncbi:hypothetical protein V1509DRAFT_574217 [Lipomyces kononenkoae]